MQNILSSEQMRKADEHAVQSRSISSLQLMEDASRAFAEIFIKRFSNKSATISIFCGTGNNGGDGLCIARLLQAAGYSSIQVCIVRYNEKSTADFEVNLKRLHKVKIPVSILGAGSSFPEPSCDILIDAMLGSGLNRPLKGEWLDLVAHLNKLKSTFVNVDVPSGFLSQGDYDETSVFMKSDLTITFQRPKINFFLPDTGKAIKEFIVADIGLNEEFIQNSKSEGKLIEEQDIRDTLKPREKFSHKGTYGHALIIAGSEKTMGAALLCAAASVYSGAGLTTACIPKTGNSSLNIRLPEAMILNQELKIRDFTKYSSIGIGPGLGQTASAGKLLTEAIETQLPLVVDADALNMIAKSKTLLKKLPRGKTILTPHMKEFDRLFGKHKTWWSRMQTAKAQAQKSGLVIVLKNRYTFIVTPSGNILINPTGSPAMATGGMGDVLTGMIASFLAQDYSPEDAAMTAVYTHGKCGQQKKQAVIPASVLIKEIPEVLYTFLD